MSSILGKLFDLMALFPLELIARVQKGAETTLVRRAWGQASAQSIRDDKPTSRYLSSPARHHLSSRDEHVRSIRSYQTACNDLF
jgi:hypothetical protein